VDVHGKTLGILGMGRIGRAVARRARLGFGMDILYFGRRDAPEAESAFGARRLPLDELLKTSDFVCVVLPLDASTEQLIGEREFSLMKPGAIFINGARGRIVDESALVAALESGRLRAAGLDVFEREPLAPSSPLAQLPNVVALPHAGSATVETRYAMCQLAVDNLISALAGRPRHVVNLSAMARRRSAAAQLEPGK
jgi:phosphogluconate 2-dehydrogenase/gluconate 2-dehydrogenase